LPTLLHRREIKIATTERQHYTLTEMAINKMTGNHMCWRGCGEAERLVWLVEIQISTTTWEKSLAVLNTYLPYDPAISLLATYSREIKTYVCKNNTYQC
jgi:hypothetical protein